MGRVFGPRSLMFTAAVFVCVAAIPGLGQQKPDFSGEWVLNRSASTLSPGADGVKSGGAQIDHREPTFHYKAEFVTGANPIRIEYELQSDGREVTATLQGIQSVSTLRWEGSALLYSGRIQRPDGGEVTISMRHELLDEGRRLRETEQLRGTGRDQDNVWIFDRR